MDEALLVWIAAIESGFALEDEWVAWANHQITEIDEPPQWLLHVRVAHTAKEALAVLYPACGTIAQQVSERLDCTGLQLGFLYLKFERDASDLLGLLLKAGDLTDRANFQVPCEAFYLLANEIDGKGPIEASPRPLVDRVAQLFMPFSESARRLWSRLQTEAAGGTP